MVLRSYVFAVVAFLTDLSKETTSGWLAEVFLPLGFKSALQRGNKPTKPKPLIKQFFMDSHSYASKTLNVIQAIAMPSKF